MIQSFAKIVSLIILLVGIAASQTTLFAETEFNFLYENISLADANSDTDNDTDDPESLLSYIPTANCDNARGHQNDTMQYTAYLFLNTPFSIRAPPHHYL